MAAGAIVAPSVTHGATRRHWRSPQCPPPHAHVVLADSAAVVFRLEDPITLAFSERACSHGSRSPFMLDQCPEFDCEGNPGFEELALSGNMLAYEVFYHEGSFRYQNDQPKSWVVQVHDLKTHQLIHSAPASTSPPPPRKVIGGGPAEGIVVKSDGSVAWIGAIEGWHKEPLRVNEPTEALSYQVWEIDRTGQHLLASGPQIVPHSIALAGSTVYWTDSGAPRSAHIS